MWRVVSAPAWMMLLSRVMEEKGEGNSNVVVRNVFPEWDVSKCHSKASTQRHREHREIQLKKIEGWTLMALMLPRRVRNAAKNAKRTLVANCWKVVVI